MQAREWWSTQVSEDEEFDTGCLCLANIDNEPSGANKIITGSYQGMLRMYYPKQKEYKIEDLILESNMEAPILQIEAGRFVQGSREICMALLHPLKLSVYMVSAVSSGGSVNYYSMALAYEHKLSRPAFNMCYGCFGGVRDRDYFCVQSLDGVLSFFEQESFAFSRMLTTNFLVPGPICYVPKIDSFVICTDAMCIEAYRYQVLAAAADNVDQSAGDGAPGKKVQVDWSTNIGEHARSIEVVRFSRSLSANQQEILVVGEQTIYTLKDCGGIRLQKRLAEYGITASLAYKMPPESPDASANHNLILGTSTGHCLVLKEMQLVWCARLQGMVPAQICVDTVGGVRGMVVLMDGKGKLQICYLGTDPPTASLVNTEMKELNYDEMEEEHQELLRVIRQTHGDGATEPEESLVVDSQVPQVLDLGMNEDDCDADDPVGRSDGMVMQLTVNLCVTLGGGKAVENVSITLKAPQCFALSQTSIFIDKVEPGRPPVIIPIVFRVWNKILCSNLEVAVCASYYSLNNEPRTVASSFLLPFALVAKPIPPVKNAKHKIQLDCNKQPPQLQVLFAGLLNQPHVSAAVSQGMSNLLSIQYVSGTEATVLMLKSSGRFCVQAAEFAALWVLTQELCNRLYEYFGPGGEGAAADDEEPFFITFQDSLPLHDYFALIDDHFDLRRHLDELRKDLADRTQQYRVIQKRLLVRFKDRNPSPLNHLDTLLNLTFEQTLLLTDAIDDVEQALRTVSCHLSAATELVLLLIKFRFGMDEENFIALRRHLTPEVCDTTEQGWEEKVDTSLLHLLRTALARSVKEGNSLPPPMKVSKHSPKRHPQAAEAHHHGGRPSGNGCANDRRRRGRWDRASRRRGAWRGRRMTCAACESRLPGGTVLRSSEAERHARIQMRRLSAKETAGSAAKPGDGSKGSKGGVLADQVKRGQRESKRFKERWWDYCDKYGKGFYDPHRHEQRFLQDFLDLEKKRTDAGKGDSYSSRSQSCASRSGSRSRTRRRGRSRRRRHRRRHRDRRRRHRRRRRGKKRRRSRSRSRKRRKAKPDSKSGDASTYSPSKDKDSESDEESEQSEDKQQAAKEAAVKATEKALTQARKAVQDAIKEEEARQRAQVEGDVLAVQAEVEQEIVARLSDAKEKLMAEKASRLQEAEERLDQVFACRLQDATANIRKAIQANVDEGRKELEAKAQKALQDARAKQLHGQAEKLQEAEKRLKDAKARLSNLKGDTSKGNDDESEEASANEDEEEEEEDQEIGSDESGSDSG
eukprot:s2827_g10.t1